MIYITLDLSKHCIETEIKRLYNHSLSACLRKKEAAPELEECLEMLQAALKTYNFSYLRAGHKELCGSSAARIRLEGDGRKMPVLTINGCPIDTCRRP